MPTSPKSHFLGPQTFHPVGQSSPLPAPPFLRVYSPCLWWAMKKAKPGKIWKFLTHKFGPGSPNKGLQRTQPKRAILHLPRMPVCANPGSHSGVVGHSSASLPMPPASFCLPAFLRPTSGSCLTSSPSPSPIPAPHSPKPGFLKAPGPPGLQGVLTGRQRDPAIYLTLESPNWVLTAAFSRGYLSVSKGALLSWT